MFYRIIYLFLDMIGIEVSNDKSERITKMHIDESLQCPKCSGTDFIARYESTYVYSYKIETPSNNGSHDTTPDAVPFLFDDREQKGSKQYIECCHCKAKYPCEFTIDAKHVDFTIVQKAIRGNYATDVEFWG